MSERSSGDEQPGKVLQVCVKAAGSAGMERLAGREGALHSPPRGLRPVPLNRALRFDVKGGAQLELPDRPEARAARAAFTVILAPRELADRPERAARAAAMSGPRNTPWQPRSEEAGE